MNRSVEDTLLVRMETTLRKFEREMERGRKVAVKSATDSERSWKRAGGQIAANANHAATGLQRLTNVSKGGRFVLQNTANQIGDIAVQISSGTDKARAMGQQLPQLFGGFAALGGPLGLVGPLLGTVAALGIPVTTALLSMGDGAESSEKQIKGLKAALDEYRSAADRAKQPYSELFESYGAEADQAMRLLEIQREIARIRYQRQFSSAASNMADQVGGDVAGSREEIERVGRLIEAHKQLFAARQRELESLKEMGRARSDADTARMRELRGLMGQSVGVVLENEKIVETLQDLEQRFNISTESAADLLATLSDIQNAPGPAEQAHAFQQLAELIFQATNGLRDADEEAQVLYQDILNVAEAGMEFEKIDFKSGPEAGAAAMREFKQEIWDAVSAANKLSGLGVQGGRGGDPRGFETDPYWKDRYLPDPENPKRKKKKKAASRGKSEDLRAAEKIYENTRTEAEKYAVELERINELHRKFPEIVTSEVKDRAVEALKESATAAGQMAKRMERGFEQAFEALVFGSGKGSDALRALALDLAKISLRGAAANFDISGLVGGIFGGKTGSGGGGLLAGLGKLLSFDGGGYTGNGSRSGGVDGKGGFPAILHPNETVIDHTKGKMSGGVALRVVIHNAPEGNHRVQPSADGRSIEVMLEDVALKAVTGPKGQRAMRTTYGMKPRGLGG